MEKENDLEHLGTVEELIGENGKILELNDFEKKLNKIPDYARAVFLVNSDNKTILCARISKGLSESIKSLDEINMQRVVKNKQGENYITGLSRMFTL